MKLNGQTRVIVATAVALALVDIGVRLLPARTAPLAVSSNGVVTAREFRLVDEGGNVRATVSLDAAGDSGVKLYNRDGALRAQIDTWKDTPSVVLYDRQGQERTYLGMDRQSCLPLLSLHGDDASRAISLGVSDNGPNSFTLYNNGAQGYQDITIR